MSKTQNLYDWLHRYKKKFVSHDLISPWSRKGNNLLVQDPKNMADGEEPPNLFDDICSVWAWHEEIWQDHNDWSFSTEMLRSRDDIGQHNML